MVVVLWQFLVWYNLSNAVDAIIDVVVPWQFLVWYNRLPKKSCPDKTFRAGFFVKNLKNCQLFTLKWHILLC